MSDRELLPIASRCRILAVPSGPGLERQSVTAQGNARTVFRRAIERANLPAAELNARIMGNVTLVEALELTALVALRDPPRRSRFAARWLTRWLRRRRRRRSRTPL